MNYPELKPLGVKERVDVIRKIEMATIEKIKRELDYMTTTRATYKKLDDMMRDIAERAGVISI